VATVVDSLIVTLGLDPSGFTKGQKQAAADLVKTKAQAQSVAKDMSESGKKAAAFFGQMRTQVLLLFAAFTGGRGLKAFIEDVAASSAAVGRTALVLGTTTNELSKWQGAVRSVGGSAAGTAASMASLDRVLTNIALVPGSATGILPYLNALNVSLVGSDGKILKVGEALVRLNRATQGMDKRQASSILAGIGLDPSQIQLVLKSSKEFDAILKHSALYETTQGEAEAGQRISTGIDTISQGFEKLGRIIMEWLEPSITRFNARLEKMILWLKSHPEEMKKIFAAVAAGVVLIGVALGGPIAGFAALGAAIALLYSDWSDYNETGKSDFAEFYQFVEGGWIKIKAAVQSVLDYIMPTAGPILLAMKDLFIEVFKTITSALILFTALFLGDAGQIKAAWKALIANMGKLWLSLFMGLGAAIDKAAPVIFEAMKRAFGASFKWVTDRANVIWKAITGTNLFADEKDKLKPEPEKEAPGGPASASGGILGGNPGGIFGNEMQRKADWVAALRPKVEAVVAAYNEKNGSNITADELIAQAAVETNYGAGVQGKNNLFNVIADKSWSGPRTRGRDHDVNGKPTSVFFRDYGSVEESIANRLKVTQQSNFAGYNQARTPHERHQILAKGGYFVAKDGVEALDATLKYIIGMGEIIRTRGLNQVLDMFRPGGSATETGTGLVLGARGSASANGFASNDNRRGPVTVQIGDINITARTNDPKAHGAAVAEEIRRRYAGLAVTGLT